MKQKFTLVLMLFAMLFSSVCTAEQTLVLYDDFSGSLTTNWTLGRAANEGGSNTLAIVDGRLKWSQEYDYIETKQTFGDDVMVQFDLVIPAGVGSVRAGDFWMEFVSLTDNEDYTAGIYGSTYGSTYDDDRINIGRAPSLSDSTDADRVEDPPYYKTIQEVGTREGTLTFVYSNNGVQVRFENEGGEVINSAWVGTGSFTTTKIRIWASSTDRFIDNVKIYAPSSSGETGNCTPKVVVIPLGN